jgi:hypothetical protein
MVDEDIVVKIGSGIYPSFVSEGDDTDLSVFAKEAGERILNCEKYWLKK